MSAVEVAGKIIEKLEASIIGVRLAVFLDSSKTGVRTTKPNTEMFRQAMKTIPDSFVGVYDYNVHLEWLLDDLRYAGIVE